MLNETFSVIFRHRASKKLLLKHIQLNFSDDLRPNVPGVTNRSAPLIWFVKLYITFSMWIASNASFVNDNWPLEINCSLSTRIPWFAKKTTMLHLQVWHTVRKSQIVSKNCEFEFSCQKLMNHPDYDTLFSYYNLNFSANIVKIQLLFDLYLHKITILAWKFKLYRKILRLKIIKKHCFIPQTLKFTILTFSKNWIFGHNFRFSNSVQFDTQQIRVWIISKLCGSWLVIYFPDRKRLQKQ